MTTVAVLGVGRSGSHAARQIAATPSVDRVVVYDRHLSRAGLVARAVRTTADAVAAPSPHELGAAHVVVLATPCGTHQNLARHHLAAGRDVVSLSDDPREVEALRGLAPVAAERGRSLIPGAAFLPGVSCVLVRLAASQLDRVDAVTAAKAGTGGPACARRHHQAQKGVGWEFVAGEWRERAAGSGRDLVFFPEPIGGRDTYRAALAGPRLWKDALPEATRVGARVAATRRDRATSMLPMLRPPHADGGPGAIRIEVRGWTDAGYTSVVYGVMDHPSVAAGTMAAVAATEAAEGRWASGWAPVVEHRDPVHLLDELYRRGVRAARFDGNLRRAV